MCVMCVSLLTFPRYQVCVYSFLCNATPPPIGTLVYLGVVCGGVVCGALWCVGLCSVWACSVCVGGLLGSSVWGCVVWGCGVLLSVGLLYVEVCCVGAVQHTVRTFCW